MTPEKLKVRILEDGIHAKEVNPMGYDYDNPRSQFATDEESDAWYKQWQEKESSLRTFDIEGEVLIAGNNIRLQSIMKNQRDQLHVPYEFLKDKTFNAELLPNGKIKIID